MNVRALDLFCGAGGAGMGLHRAGFDVTGVDIAPQPHYPFAFILADALTVDLEGYDFIWASPPCQGYSVMQNLPWLVGRSYPKLVGAVRERLKSSGAEWCIENVPGAPLRANAMLCGTMFGLNLLRHRVFETSFPIAALLPPCHHRGTEIPVMGHGMLPHARRVLRRSVRIEEKRDVMGIDWMNRDELSQAIPPAYSEWIARQYLAAQEVAA